MPKKSNKDIDYEELTPDEGEELGLQQKLKQARVDLSTCKKELQDYLTGWQRAKADLVNERKVFDKKLLETRVRAHEELLRDLLPVLDSFDMAFADKAAWERVDKNWRMGVEYIYANFISILSQYNIVPFDDVGAPFDPSQHESIEMIPTDNKEEDHLIKEVLQRGYKQGNVIIRPAKVKVAIYKEDFTSN